MSRIRRVSVSNFTALFKDLAIVLMHFIVPKVPWIAIEIDGSKDR